MQSRYVARMMILVMNRMNLRTNKMIKSIQSRMAIIMIQLILDQFQYSRQGLKSLQKRKTSLIDKHRLMNCVCKCNYKCQKFDEGTRTNIHVKYWDISYKKQQMRLCSNTVKTPRKDSHTTRYQTEGKEEFEHLFHADSWGKICKFAKTSFCQPLINLCLMFAKLINVC